MNKTEFRFREPVGASGGHDWIQKRNKPWWPPDFRHLVGFGLPAESVERGILAALRLVRRAFVTLTACRWGWLSTHLRVVTAVEVRICL